MEKRDLYDVNKNITGETIFKGLPIPDDKYILICIVFIQNLKGKFLIQKRSREKGGKYATTGGHPKSGQTSIEGIISEIQEELGLNVDKNELKLIYSGREDTKHVFFDIYYMNKDFDISSLILQKEEVDFVRWLSINEIKELIKQDLFLESHAINFNRLLEILKL